MVREGLFGRFRALKKILHLSYTISAFTLIMLLGTPALWADSSDWVQVERFEQQLAKAREGKITAMYEVGRMYERGRGVGVDLARAADWYERASSAGNAAAKARLGILHYEGRGVAQDYQQAYKLLSAAANENIPSAQYQLALMYELGRGISQDRDQAIKWYSQASKGGDYRARNKLKTLNGGKAGPPSSTSTKAATNSATVSSGTLETILQRQWANGEQPAGLLPSKISQCSLKKDRIHCRAKQERNTSTATIVYQAESTVMKFNKARFKISYSKTILEVKPRTPSSAALDENDSAPVASNLKPGQKSREIILNCELVKGKSIICSQDNIQRYKFNLSAF